MYLLDQKTKTLKEIKKCTFKGLNFKERQDLQQWIISNPSSLGEDLLIIQEEFDGWDDTKERLDLLALDKQGRLVIIENKLDDSGRDVTWQAIKYASYCASLGKQDILTIFQTFLRNRFPNQIIDANDELSNFFDCDFADMEINKDNTQRIFLIAANFHKEVTSSVLWLQNFNLNIKCFQVTPYKYGEDILVEFDQIIPVKDTEDYQIKIANKKQEESLVAETKSKREVERGKFWDKFISYNKDHNGLYGDSKGTTDSWIGKSVKTIAGGNINVIINKTICRAELYINTGEQDRNKAIFDALYEYHEELKQIIPEIEWQRMNEKVTCRVCVEANLSYTEESEQKKIFEFLNINSKLLYKFFEEKGSKIKVK